MRPFLVGGFVRDTLLGRKPKDRDWVVEGTTPQEMLDLGYTQVGADFPVFLHPETKEEYALARQERKVAPGYHGFETHFDPSVTLEDDLFRRDLRINAMAMDEDGNIIDPFNGQKDLKNGVLHHVSEAFAEDPVRVLRVARFSARYNFKVHPDTMELMKQMVNDGELDHLTPERVWLEFEKAMGEPHPTNFLWTLERCGAMNRLFPELSRKVVFVGRHLHQLALLNQNVTERFMALFEDNTPFEIHDVLERIKAPSKVKTLTLKFQKFMTVMRSRNVTAHNLMNLMKELDLFRHPDHAQLLAKTAVMTGRGNHVFTFLEAFRAAEQVTFNSLETPMLKGAEIGKAIDVKRFEVIEKVTRFR